MVQTRAKSYIEQILSQAGVYLNGNQPWDIQVHDPRFYSRLLFNPELSLGESYMAGWWDCHQLDELIFRILRYNVERQVWSDKHFLIGQLGHFFTHLYTRIVNLQSKQRAHQVAKRHYDVGNNLFNIMLDKRMNYSCGYWKDASTLDEAQEAKLDLICQKLHLKPGMRVLDIGCGFGGFSKYAAEKYGVNVIGITISQRQLEYATESSRGLPVTYRLQDYRDINEKFDRICSIGMFEHVGFKNYRTYMSVAERCLEEDGLFLLHTIGNNFTKMLANLWFNRYIFPNGALPSIQQIGRAAEHLFVIEDWHNFGAYYDKTLMSWQQNFQAHWEDLRSQYGDVFKRMWDFYLLASAGSARARDIQLWQIVLSKKGIVGGYDSVR
jgi:cyclopropane-fatty-acyl-phospholipid synthase